MSLALPALVAAFGIVNLLLFGALVELYRDVQQIREFAGLIDRPVSLTLNGVQGTAPSLYGLPPDLDEVPSGLVLFLSEKCGTCRAIASSLQGTVPTGVWLVLAAEGAEGGREWLEAHGLAGNGQPEDRIVLDVAGRMASKIGLDVTPAGIFVERGRFASGSTIPSARQLAAITPRTIHLTPEEAVK